MVKAEVYHSRFHGLGDDAAAGPDIDEGVGAAAWRGKRWQKLHRLVYLTAIAGVVHYYWLVKSDIRWPVFYGTVVALLLASRLVGSPKKKLQSSTTLVLARVSGARPAMR